MNSKLDASTSCEVWSRFAKCLGKGFKEKISTSYKGRKQNLWLVIFLFFSAFLTTSSFGQAGCILTCDDQKNISIGTEGYAVIFPELVLNGNFDCAKPVSVEVLDATGLSIGDTLRCEQVGKRLTVKVHGSDGAECWSSIVVEDKLATSIRCADLFIPCTASIDPDTIGYPTLHDNCTASSVNDLNYFDLFTELPCGTLEEGREVNARITRSWTIIDIHGNLGVCTQNIYLLKSYINNVVFPGDCNGIDRDVLNCSNNPDDLTFSGAPTINGMPVENADLCKFYVSYQDQTTPICPPASFRRLRRWEVIDLCTKEVRVHIQDIISADNTPPDLICPDSFSLSANSINCTASVILPRATASDSCSNVVVQPTWEFGAGYGPFTDIPGGTHIITYTATDECGNTSVCTTKLTVVDNTKPVAVCRELVHIALTNEGTATVAATIFDGGSKDNCSISKIEAKRDSTFSDVLTFDCDDLDRSIPIVLRVYDAVGLQNECRSQVLLDDEILPTLVCPATAIVDCQANYEDSSLTGEATSSDLCGIEKIYYVDAKEFNACGTYGTILRNWFAEDLAGNIGTCTQQINVVDQTPLEIIFPEEYTTYECNSDLSPERIGKPIITGEDCETLLISNEDEIFLLGDSSCYQILRIWKVIDWCLFNGIDNANGGFYSSTQIINVFDRDAPVITVCPPDVTVSISTLDCEASVELALAEATDCNTNLTIINTSTYADFNDADASGLYPVGITEVMYIANDGCGNSSTCEVSVTVIDEQSPTPVCKHSISIALRENGSVLVPSNAINSGSYDNCSPSDSLTYEIMPNYFTCDHIGQQEINLIVTDQSGNADFCTTDIFIQDNHSTCDPNSFSVISGRILTENGAAMEAVEVEITGGMSEMNTTNETGEYRFQNLSKLEDYTIRPRASEHLKDGVSTFDLVLIQKHILGVELLDSPYKIIAADINNSTAISTYDVVLLRRIILGIIDEIPNNQSWRYVAADYEFPDTSNPFAESFTEIINYTRLLASEVDKDFIGIKIGDVNNSASPSQRLAGSRTSKDLLLLSLPEMMVEKGIEYKIPVRATDFQQILGYQMTLQLDSEQLVFKEVIPGKPINMTTSNFGLTHIDKGFLTTSWEHTVPMDLEASTILFTLVVEAKQATQLSKALSINSSITKAEAYTEQAALMDIALEFKSDNSKESLALFQNHPNPFKQTTIISFQLPATTFGTISIYNLNGQVLKTYSNQYTQGYNEISVDLSDLSIGNSVLYYHLETPITQRLTQKMVLFK